ncbi:MAG: adenylate/guanylate cyclase domain-containing protein [Rhodovibrionaceae bacterium]|nr:adenylate/guanylate cyclase domain-containing protein [Rhodovibrionaceae bacterium]
MNDAAHKGKAASAAGHRAGHRADHRADDRADHQADQGAGDRLARLESALKSLDMGVAIADPETWAVRFENARFFQWFAPAEPDPLAEDDAEENGEASLLDRRLADPKDGRIAGLELAAARQRLEERGRLAFECERKAGPRTLSLKVQVTRHALADGPPVLVAQVENISKLRETEYMLDSYSRMMEKTNRDLQKEKERVEKLLLNIMPRVVYEEMKDFGATTPQRFDSATVLLLDFKDFTEMAVSRDPAALIGELNDIFSAFDRIVELYNCERIKTIGDAYMCVSGLPEVTEDHAANIAKVALRMRRYLYRRNASHPNQWLCRIGISTGPVIGSMVGIQKYVYDVFGPAVNMAARLEARAEPMTIVVDQTAHDALREDFRLSERGEEDVRGFGMQMLYVLEEEIRGRV